MYYTTRTRLHLPEVYDVRKMLIVYNKKFLKRNTTKCWDSLVFNLSEHFFLLDGYVSINQCKISPSRLLVTRKIHNSSTFHGARPCLQMLFWKIMMFIETSSLQVFWIFAARVIFTVVLSSKFVSFSDMEKIW